ncbi:MAG: flagellar type III secretion system protein FliR [Clostridiaceae bacterium]|nr:flagellar type III secretion system protein FliR [Clostridiaceae bacterium]MBW4858751.1 flagellar type III secretion system protein FliR [Clostridiaceae bacterium]MBW4868210.1 flagellar type III secretion system protein FliR [Clostridiaceae bacterium]
MNDILNILTGRYELLLLVFVRISGIFLFSPLFSSQNVPNMLKLSFSFIFSLLLTSSFEVGYIGGLDGSFLLLIIKELMVGIIIGYISYAFFSAFYILGQIVDMEIGFGMVNVIDPQNKVQIPVMGNFYYILAFLLFLLTNGHHLVIKALIDSYEYIPIGEFAISQATVEQLVNILAKTFSLGFKIASPIVITILLMDILLGVLSRTIPQMNVFVVGMPLKIIVGMLVIAVTIPIFNVLTGHVFKDMLKEIYFFLKSP